MSQAQTTVPATGLLLDNVDWGTYTRFLHLFAERPGYRLTYDRGVLEIMSPLLKHDHVGRFLGRLVVTLTEELGLPVLSGGSTTFRRRKKKRGLEPDECFWIANESRIRDKDRIDLRVDPPPDLAIEVDVTRSSLNRMSIYATLGVPEVWRFDGTTLTFNVLQANGRYATTPTGIVFPMVAPQDLVGFLALRASTEENALVQQFRAWVRQRRPGGTPPQTP
jgi:Uma2 family endonuclease